MRPKSPRDPFAGPESGPEPPFPIKLSGPVIKGFGRGSRELGIPTANIPPSGLAAYPDLQSGVYYGFVGLKLHPDTTQPADNSKLTLSSPVPDLSAGQPMPERGNDATALNDVANANGQGGVSDGGGDGGKRGGAEGKVGGGGEQGESRTEVFPAVLSIGYNPYYKNETRSIEIHVLHHFPSYNFYHSPLNLLILGFIRPEYDYESLEALVDDIKTDCDVARRSLEREAYMTWKEGEAGEWLRSFEWVGGVDVKKIESEIVGKGGSTGEGTGDGEGGKL